MKVLAAFWLRFLVLAAFVMIAGFVFVRGQSPAIKSCGLDSRKPQRRERIRTANLSCRSSRQSPDHGSLGVHSQSVFC